jgi:hypothetical protein
VTWLVILKDYLFYKHKGRAFPDEPSDENPLVVTGQEDARAQRLADLYMKDHSEKKRKNGRLL